MASSAHLEPAAGAAKALRSAGALVITAGAGMGVDSGLPDFRGDAGFWKAYPPYQRLGISFVDAANPSGFEGDPGFGWGFYGHRLHLYRATVPHRGFAILHHLQCTTPCSGAIWENLEEVPVDLETMRAGHVPRCPRCGAVSRPNILMFGDWAWIADRSHGQRRALEAWLAGLGDARLVAIELGAGTAIPTIRHATERLGSRPGATAVRLNPREPAIAAPHLSLPVGALAGLEAIDAALGG